MIQRFGRFLGRVIRAGIALWLLTYAAVLGWTYLWPMERALPQGDVIVCLSGGGDVPLRTPDGVPSRAETCAALFAAGAAPRVLFTGGALDPRLPSSAETMAAATDLPEDVVVIEPDAQSTLQNALFSIPLLDPDSNLILVTEAYHLPRAWMSFHLMGSKNATLYASTRVVRNENGAILERHPILRESLAIWFNLARFAAYIAAGWIGTDDDTRAVWLT